MFKFSRTFFVLFVLLTVLPVFLLILWNIFTFQDIERSHIDYRLSNKIREIEFQYTSFLDDEKKYLQKLINSTKNYNLNLEKYREILNNDQVWWIDLNNNNELEITSNAPFKLPPEYPDKGQAYYELIYNEKKQDEQLVAIFIIPSSVSGHKGLAVAEEVNYKKLTPFEHPGIVRIFTGKDYNPSNLLYDNFEDRFLKYKKHKPPQRLFGPQPPKFPPKNIEIEGKQFELKNNYGNAVATVKIGIPSIKEPFWFFPNPMLAGIFEKFYLLGALIPVLGLILSIFAGLYLKKYFLNPIEDLSNVSKEASFGNLSARVNSEIKHSEIRNTLKNFNNMLDSLQEKEELQKNFITNLTHDFRTPLLAENRTLELLLEELKDTSKPEQVDLLESLLRNNEHLLEMVNLLLENYKFESGKLKLRLKCINMENLVQQCFAQLRTLAEYKNIELKIEFDPEIPEIIVDNSLIKRSFINLIVNALENIPKNSKIIVKGKIEGSELIIKFWDNGPGISKEEAEKLFDRYYTGNHSERKIGSGLGLYICRKFIEAHGGKITVDTEKGKYSEFIVSLPIAQENIL